MKIVYRESGTILLRVDQAEFRSITGVDYLDANIDQSYTIKHGTLSNQVRTELLKLQSDIQHLPLLSYHLNALIELCGKLPKEQENGRTE